MKTAAQVLVETLETHGVQRVFCVPGESYLPVLDALRDARIETISCRHEAAAANMAEAHGKLTGRPGVCFVTRGPGATHASIGVHTAKQDSTPMILFIGQVAREDRGKEAFQEVDFPAFFAPLAKWAEEAEDPERLPAQVARAFAAATQGRPGPAVLSLPEDVLRIPISTPAAAPLARPSSAPSGSAIAAVLADLRAAQRPLVVLGGGGWDAKAVADYARFATAWDLPTCLSFRRKDLLDNDHPSYIGDLGLGPNAELIRRAKDADLVLAIGARLGENPTQGYTLWTPSETAARLIHIHPDPAELNRVWPAKRAIVSDVDAAVAALADAAPAAAVPWATERAAARVSYEAFSRPLGAVGEVNLGVVVAQMGAHLAPDAIVCNGAGNYAGFVHRFHRHRGFRTQIAPTSGAMGYSVPAAIAAKLAYPQRQVVAFAGDGCFLMCAQELATARQYGANIVVIVCDNASYGTIRMHQERDFPGRQHATDLVNPDFAAFARAFGCHAATVDRTEDFSPAFAAALSADRPALIHLRLSIEDIAPGRVLSPAAG